jgi:hypothetical protein
MLSLPTRRELAVNYWSAFLKAYSALAASFAVDIV